MQRLFRLTRHNVHLKYINLNVKARRKRNKLEFERVLVSFHHYIAAEWCVSFFTIINMLCIDASKFKVRKFMTRHIILSPSLKKNRGEYLC